MISDLGPRIQDGSLSADLLGLFHKYNPFEDEHQYEEEELL